MTTTVFYRRVMGDAGVGAADAKRLTAAVLHALRDRLTTEEAAQAAAQLPREIRLVWGDGETPRRRPEKMHRRAFFDRVRGEAGLGTLTEARDATYAVFGALKDQLSDGEGHDVLSQLPKDLKEVWELA
jgi:uncharacterized protein (DUF2267 family)